MSSSTELGEGLGVLVATSSVLSLGPDLSHGHGQGHDHDLFLGLCFCLVPGSDSGTGSSPGLGLDIGPEKEAFPVNEGYS